MKKVNGFEGLVKDEISHAVLNADSRAFNEFMAKKKEKEAINERFSLIEQRLNKLQLMIESITLNRTQ